MTHTFLSILSSEPELTVHRNTSVSDSIIVEAGNGIQLFLADAAAQKLHDDLGRVLAAQGDDAEEVSL